MTRSFDVTIRTCGEITLTVKADDEDQAREKVWDHYQSHHVALSSDIESCVENKSAESSWDSVDECVEWIKQQPDQIENMLNVVRHNLIFGENGFATEVFDKFVKECT